MVSGTLAVATQLECALSPFSWVAAMKLLLVFLSCLALLSFIEAQTPALGQLTNCTVRGQIVQQPGGSPIRKADIRLLGDEAQYAAVTDAEGRFTIEDVKPGEYRLYFEHAGFVDAEKRHHGSGMLLSLEPAQGVKNLVFHMAQAAVITGKVTDSDGDPLPQVDVAAIPYGPRHSNSQAVGGSTNDVGEYRIGGLAPERYLVVAQPLSQLSKAVRLETNGSKNVAVYATTYYPGTTDKSQAVPLELHPGDETPVNITLDSAHTFHVRGVVTNLPAGTGGEVSVILRPLDDDAMGVIELWQLDRDGGFDIRGVLPGSYSVLLVLGSGRTPQMMRGDQTAQVTNADLDGLRISPLANGQVRGRVRMDNGQKIDWSQVDVRLYSNRRAAPGSMTSSGNGFEAIYWDDVPAYAQVGSDGSFEMKSVPADAYRLRVELAGKTLQNYFVKAANLGGKDVADSGFTVGGASYSLDIIVSAHGASVEGVAVDDKAKPISDVQVICIPDASRRERHDLYQRVTTDHRGQFSLRGLNPGEYRVFTLDADVDEREITDPEFVRTHESLGQTVKLAEGERKSIVLKLAVAGD